MAKGGGGGQMGAGASVMPGGKPPLPPGAVASGGGGPPPLPGAVSPYGQQPGGDMYPGTYRGGGTNQGELEALYSGVPYGHQSGGGGGVWIPPQTTRKITPGGGNQNAFSPRAATVEDVTTPGRWAFANLMARMSPGFRKQSGTGDRQGGYG